MALNLGMNLRGRQICLEFHKMRSNWGLRTRLGDDQAGFKMVYGLGFRVSFPSLSLLFPTYKMGARLDDLKGACCLTSWTLCVPEQETG